MRWKRWAYRAQKLLDQSGKQLAARLSGRGGCVIKCGAEGARLWSAASVQYAAAQPVTVVDTIGAGDSFNAGFLTALLYHQPSHTALRWGIEVASQAISSSPRRYPSWQQLQLSNEVR